MIGTLFCILMCVFTLIFAALYGFDKNPDKTASTIAGFNNFSGVSEEERRKYDTAKMVKDMRNLMLILSAVCFVGIFLTLLSQWLTIPVFIVWLAIVIKNTHMDSQKAFEKYRIEK